MKRSAPRQPLWYASLLHRVSGLALALFLPLHFLVLGSAIQGPEAMDSVLHWSQLPVIKAAEFLLVFFLAVHFFGGLRLLALEFLPWSSRQKTFAALAVSLSFLAGCVFLLRLV